METIFQALMKAKLVVLGGVCHSAPTSAQMFASFEVRVSCGCLWLWVWLNEWTLTPTHTVVCMSQVLVFVYVSTKAFAIFNEEHPQFHLSDALYAALEMLHAESAAPSDEEAANGPASPSEELQDKTSGLDALFSDVVGSSDDEDDSVHAAATALADELAPFLNNITLREHQRIAVRWMLARENQVASNSVKSTPSTLTSNSDSSSVGNDVNPVGVASRSVSFSLSLSLHSPVSFAHALVRAPVSCCRCGRRGRSNATRARTL